MAFEWLEEYPITLNKLRKYVTNNHSSMSAGMAPQQEMTLINSFLQTRGFTFHTDYDMQTSMWTIVVHLEGELFTGDSGIGFIHMSTIQALQVECIKQLEDDGRISGFYGASTEAPQGGQDADY